MGSYEVSWTCALRYTTAVLSSEMPLGFAIPLNAACAVKISLWLPKTAKKETHSKGV